ncbi:hypothetical protein Dimus_028602 [Dionaea muscipula]
MLLCQTVPVRLRQSRRRCRIGIIASNIGESLESEVSIGALIVLIFAYILFLFYGGRKKKVENFLSSKPSWRTMPWIDDDGRIWTNCSRYPSIPFFPLKSM